jgi:biotin carboxylase
VQMIRKVRELGYKALVVDREAGCVGAQAGDFFEQVDTTDFAGVKRVAERYGIIGSLTASSDVAVPTACYINEVLRLPRQGDRIHHVVADKSLMKKCFVLGGVSSPAFYIVENEEQLQAVQDVVEREMPLTGFIVKPADSSGSRGVAKLETASELAEKVEAARAFSRTGKVIVEEFIEGVKIGVETFSLAGDMRLCLHHNSTLSPGMINIGHSFPLAMSEETMRLIRDECEKALRSIGIENGPVNFDLIIDEQGQPFVLEINARLAGTRLPELVQAHCGIDLLDLTVRVAAGEVVEIPEINRHTPVAVRILHFDVAGRIEKIGPVEHLFETYPVMDFRLDLGAGMQVVPFSAPAHQYGYVICKGDTVEQAERNCFEFLEELKGKIVFDEMGWGVDEAIV